jgi:aminopeptidase N
VTPLTHEESAARARLIRATLNGAPITSDALTGNRIRLAGLASENTLVVVADMACSSPGNGLYRFTDPADGETYLYATSFPAQA